MEEQPSSVPSSADDDVPVPQLDRAELRARIFEEMDLNISKDDPVFTVVVMLNEYLPLLNKILTEAGETYSQALATKLTKFKATIDEVMATIDTKISDAAVQERLALAHQQMARQDKLAEKIRKSVRMMIAISFINFLSLGGALATLFLVLK
jgi:hypothetical protein